MAGITAYLSWICSILLLLILPRPGMQFSIFLKYFILYVNCLKMVYNVFFFFFYEHVLFESVLIDLNLFLFYFFLL